MATITIDHPLALAVQRARVGDDARGNAQVEGAALDVRLAALAGLSSTSDATRTLIRTLVADVARATTYASGGEDPAFYGWQNSAMQTLRVAADRLFAGESWIADVRGLNWSPR